MEQAGNRESKRTTAPAQVVPAATTTATVTTTTLTLAAAAATGAAFKAIFGLAS